MARHAAEEDCGRIESRFARSDRGAALLRATRLKLELTEARERLAACEARLGEQVHADTVLYHSHRPQLRAVAHSHVHEAQQTHARLFWAVQASLFPGRRAGLLVACMNHVHVLALGRDVLLYERAPEPVAAGLLQENQTSPVKGEGRALKGRQQHQAAAASALQGADAWSEVAQLRAALQASQQRCQEAEDRARIAGQQVLENETCGLGWRDHVAQCQ